jgi:Caspase domain
MAQSARKMRSTAGWAAWRGGAADARGTAKSAAHDAATTGTSNSRRVRANARSFTRAAAAGAPPQTIPTRMRGIPVGHIGKKSLVRRILLAAVLVLAVAVFTGATQLDQQAAEAGPPSKLDKWALLVGLDHFQGRTHPNSGSIGDVQDAHDALVRNGWPEDHIKVLTDSAAPAGGIRAGLQWLVDNSSDHSYSVFHYSGHVKQSGRTEYLWPYDNSFIPDTQLAGYIRQLKGWAWVDIAGCEAAGFDEGISAPNRLFTASSQANEKSYELPPDHHNSVYGYYLFDEGMNQGRADYNHDGRVSVTEAFNYAVQHAPSTTSGASHGPQHPFAAGGDGNEWFLEPPPPPPSSSPPPKQKPTCPVACIHR